MDSLRRFFTRNIGLKVTSVFLALILWVYVGQQQSTRMTVVVPFRPINVPEFVKTPIVISPPYGEVAVEGPKEKLEQYSENLRDLISIEVDLSQAALFEGKAEADITGRNVQIPFAGALNLNILEESISPQKVQVDVVFNTRIVPVDLPEIETGELYTVRNVTVEPAQFELAGSPSTLERLNSLRPPALVLRGLEAGPFSQEVEVPVANGRARVVMEVDGFRRASSTAPKVVIQGELAARHSE